MSTEEGSVKTKARHYSAGFEDEGKGHEAGNAALEARKGREMGSSLEPMKGEQPCDTLISAQ